MVDRLVGKLVGLLGDSLILGRLFDQVWLVGRTFDWAVFVVLFCWLVDSSVGSLFLFFLLAW